MKVVEALSTIADEVNVNRLTFPLGKCDAGNIEVRFYYDTMKKIPISLDIYVGGVPQVRKDLAEIYVVEFLLAPKRGDGKP